MEILRFNQLLGDFSCVIERNGVILHQLEGAGLHPLIWLIEKHPEDLHGSTVCDKVIGRAAAALLITYGAAAVYGQLMSHGAVEWLAEYNIVYAYNKLVPAILRRDRTGLCPMEQLSVSCEKPQDAAVRIMG